MAESSSMTAQPHSNASAHFDTLAKSLKARPFYGYAITFAQVMADYLAVFVCYMGSYWIYKHGLKKASPQSFYEFLIFALAVGGLYVLILDRVGLYRREVSLLNIKELRGISYSGMIAAAIVLSSSFYIRSVVFSRVTLTVALFGSPILIYFERLIFYRFHLLFHQRGWAQRKVLIYGAGNIGTHLAKRLFESPSLGLMPVGFLDDHPEKIGTTIRWQGIGPKEGVKVLGSEEILKDRKKLGVEMLMIALPSASFERNQKLVETCLGDHLEYCIVPNSYEKFIQNIELFEIGGIPLLRRRIRKVSFYYLIWKRVFDFLTATVLLLLLSPLIIFFAIAIKLDSRGPIIFRQKRVGLMGREFSFYKFRTMHVDAPKYAVSPDNATDPRITRIGRWLRRTSLDELPQLFNVWRGDMSLVGPRPEMPFIVATYSPLHRLRLEAKPGITGVWQISGARGEPIHANIEYDIFYLENRSLLLDLAVLIKTFLSVIRGIGAV